MNKKTRFITVAALLSALSVGLLYLAGILPTLRLAFIAAAGLASAAAVIELGLRGGLACFAVSGLFGLIILPLKSVAVIYLLFFGYYPVVKSLAEHMERRATEYAVKFLVFNAALTAAYFLWKYGLMSGEDFGAIGVLALYGAGNAAFVLYDLGFSWLTGFYTVRIHKKR